jgi:hypothetical protein
MTDNPWPAEHELRPFACPARVLGTMLTVHAICEKKLFALLYTPTVFMFIYTRKYHKLSSINISKKSTITTNISELH